MACPEVYKFYSRLDVALQESSPKMDTRHNLRGFHIYSPKDGLRRGRGLLVVIRLVVTSLLLFWSVPVVAQQQCTGPADLCQQILQLQQQVQSQQQVASQATSQNEAKHKLRIEWSAGLAATMAMALKAIISALKSWTTWLKTDKQKAVMKIGLLLLGFLAFILTNLGFGLPWWEALIVAGGPPGAILVHEIVDLISVLQGKEPMPPDTGDSSNPPPGPPPPGRPGFPPLPRQAAALA